MRELGTMWLVGWLVGMCGLGMWLYVSVGMGVISLLMMVVVVVVMSGFL